MRRPTTRIAIAILITAATGTTLGCGEDPPPPPPPKHDYTVEVEVTDTDENPLPRVPVTLDGRVVGHTDREGKFAGKLNEIAGKDVTLGVQDITGYRFINEKTSVTETLKTTTVNGTQSGIPLYLQIQAESITKDYLVWVEASCGDDRQEKCEGLPVLLDGEEVARTNRLGYAHFSFADVPQNDVMVSIDTPDDEDEKLEPADPQYALTLDLDSHIYMIDETFEPPGAAKSKTKRRRRRPRRRRAARRRKASSKKKAPKTAPKKKKKDDEGAVIDLW